MPIDRSKYPEDWDEISKRVIAEAENQCELCMARNHEPHWMTGSKVVLTVHHINGDTMDRERLNLVALCQRCHLRLDLSRHLRKRAVNRIRMSLQTSIDGLEYDKMVAAVRERDTVRMLLDFPADFADEVMMDAANRGITLEECIEAQYRSNSDVELQKTVETYRNLLRGAGEKVG